MNYLNLRTSPALPGLFLWCETVRLRVEVEDDTIIVTLPGTSLRVNYRKTKYSQLVTVDFRGDKNAGIPLADFLARAWPVANDKARELGWII